MPYLGKQGDLICYVMDTREEIEAIPFVSFTSIEYTDKEYVMVDGTYIELDSLAAEAPEDESKVEQ
ncbi:MAG: hypothetical protein NC218_08285 [Acetobacter sp.]|nr:hypothetical protein [Acetobacter sp.]